MKYNEKDNSPISSNSLATGAKRDFLSPNEIQRLLKLAKQANEVHLATVREIYYVDDIKNQSKTQVEYRVRIEFGDRHGQEYESVTALNLYGGVVNISEFVYSQKEQVLKGTRDAEDQYMFTHDASQVVVAFMDGFPNRPFIIGGWNHTNNDIFATKRKDGIRRIEEFNGIRLETNDDGEFILIYYGGKRNTKSKKTIRSTTAPTRMKLSKDGAWSIDDKENQKINVDRANKKITIEQRANVKPDETYGKEDTSDPGTLINSIELDKANKKITTKVGNTKITEVFDGNAEKVTLTFQSGLTITCDGAGDKAIIQTAGGSKIDVNGTTGTVELKDNGTGKLKITGNRVALGAASAELLEQISQSLQALITLTASMQTETHIGNLGYSSSPPENLADYTTAEITLTSLKALVDGIKGTL